MNAPTGEETIFAEALRLAPNERAAWLAQSTSGNAELRRRVEALLGSYGAGDFLEQSAAPQCRQTLHVSIPLTEKAGDTIGRYKLLQQIGEGGCGVVYMAEQAEPVRRRVALKIIKLGMDTKSVIARFEAERQALAMMDHPNIAKVLDAGATETGRPYFVMELVRGMKITEYCDEKKLTTRERLDLFIHVCHAIQHAHQKGIIHRDIKPSNILVTVNDGAPVPKVIDFGIAKATSGQQLTDKTLFTAFEQFIGTPAYMSPEQAVLTSLDIDTRSDIYALGVLLYEMLTGRTPFDAKELFAIGLDEMRRTIREQEPPRPSTRLSTLPGQELSTAAQSRGLDAPKLVSELRGDLDWIVMKALEKDRARRYETANSMASDIERHLKHEPVVACPPSNLYRFQKMVRRNKLAFTAAAAVVAALVIGLGISTWLFLKEREARTRAVAAEHSERKLRQEAELRVLNERAFHLSTQITRQDKEAAVFARQKALEAQRRLLGNDHPDVADSLEHLAGLLRRKGNLTEGEQTARDALAMHRKHAPEGDPGVAASLTTLLHMLADQDKLFEAEEVCREMVSIWRRFEGNEGPNVAVALNFHGRLLVKQKRKAEALPFYREAFTIRRKRVPDGEQTLTAIAGNLMGTLIDLDRLTEAVDLARDFVPRNAEEKHGLTAQVERLARHLSEAGRSREAEQLLNDLLSKAPDSAELLESRAQFFARGGRYENAATDYRRVVELKPDQNEPFRQCTALRAYLNQRQEFDEHCRRYLEKFSETADSRLVERTAKACLLLPGPSGITWAAIDLADGLDAESAKSSWIACVKALAEYRRGTYQAALDCLQRIPEGAQDSACEAQTSAIAAMAHFQLNQTDEAIAALSRANDLASDGREKMKEENGDGWDNWLRAFVLIREASALIEGNATRTSQQP